ncbi:ATPase, T2SS/T4P/T4SS family [Paludibacterium sp. THUN1379]|uniref:GspE/PulE family protein n=1 Tax=Paludibacterium sp. THUN1379 TaxID=3112107 RepID=UPI003091D4E5|nr:ATPase, T2SS/T4P/T4SS family [Paludibacterium sp. THUN1379]
MFEHEPSSAYLQSLIEAAIGERASDIHLEPGHVHSVIRWRIDGQLRPATLSSPVGHDRLVSCAKVLAQMDIAERRLPQDGRFDFTLPDGVVRDIRVSSLPTLAGEKLVMRILSQPQALPLSALGLASAQLQRLQQGLARPHGMLLMTGPTGSGKTTTLYACLQSLSVQTLNVSTVEDPVEMALEGVHQVAVCERSGLDFPLALRALLRQDPDVIMVGEMRDGLTADIAIKAAQTGHLVLSSLHTASARASIARLLNMGVSAVNLASARPLIVSQRLLRRLCRQCRLPVHLSPGGWRELGWPQALPEQMDCHDAAGCPACQFSGYHGRIGIFELLQFSEEGRGAEMQETGPNLRQAALLKVMQGETSLAEALAQTVA